jgi:hypothetical protein
MGFDSSWIDVTGYGTLQDIKKPIAIDPLSHVVIR